MMISSRLKWNLLSAIILISLALFFRTYVLQGLSSQELRDIHERAVNTVTNIMRTQIRPVLDAEFPLMGETKKQVLLNQRVQEIIREQRGEYEFSVQETEKNLLGSRETYYSSRYLLEADPYYYLRLTNNVLRTGRLGVACRNGKFLNPVRYLPTGHWDDVSLHPYVGAAVYRVLHFFKHSMTVMHAVSYVPLLLSCLLVIAFLFLCQMNHFDWAPSFLGCMTLVLSPMVIQRSMYAWYDTDPYNILFPTIILTTLLTSARSARGGWRWGLAGGLGTALFALFWSGWSFVFFLTAGAAFALGLTTTLTEGHGKLLRNSQYVISYASSTLIFAAFFITPAGLLETVQNSFMFITKASGAGSVWPNFFVLIGETNAVPLKKWVYLVSNGMTIGLSLIGLIVCGIERCKNRKTVEFRQWFVVTMTFLPLFVLSLKAERYVLLVVLPFSLLVILGAGKVLQVTQRFFERPYFRLISRKYCQLFSIGIVFLLVIPRTLLGADVAARISHMIMNDTWNEVLQYVRDKTPEDSVVFSWWSPGHFVTAIANRRVAVDGGAQQLRENYWIAKAFMTDDERFAAGLFRMMTAGGNGAADFLEREGWRAAPSVRLITDMVKLNRSKAADLLPQTWPDPKKQEFLDLTHGKASPPPSYVMLYDDLIKNNVILQMTANWDFEKAESVFRKSSGGGLFNFMDSGQNTYVQNLLRTAGQPLVYQADVALMQRIGPQLVFENGLMVNLETKDAYLSLPMPGKNIAVEPVNLFYRDQTGDWNLKENSQSPRPVAAILEPAGQGFAAVVAHRELIKSMLFQMYYFQAKNLKCFKPLIARYDPNSKTSVQIFEMEWEELT